MESDSKILVQQGKKHYLTELKNLPIKLSEVEKKIIEKRLIGLSFHQLSPDETQLATDKILLKGSAICGCKLPQTEEFAGVIADEITVFINEFGYKNLTLEEVLLALRLNSQGELKYPSGVEIESIAFSGQFMNIDYLGKVLSNYMKLRAFLDRKFQNHLLGHE